MSKLYKSYEKIKEKDSNKIYIFKSGMFYICLEADAQKLSEIFGFKITKLNEQIKKCGFPTSRLNYYIEQLENRKIKFEIVDNDCKRSTKRLDCLNKIDAKLNTQRIMLRVMKKFAWIDIKKFNIAMEKIYEIGKILGGLIKYYARYLDDSILIVQTKKQAKKALEEIEKFLKEKLGLKLNKKTQIFKGKQGVNFCGYKINEYRLKLRDKGKRKLKDKIKKLKNDVKNGKMDSHEAKKYIAGHIGYIKWADVYNLTNKLFYVENNFEKDKIY